LKRGEIPSIGELTSFVAAAEHGSFTRAASVLNVTQGAVSRQIHELENHLGIWLFERIRQRVVLTDAGKFYLPQVKKALDDLAVATQKVLSFSNHTTLNLAVLPTFAARWLLPRLPNFQSKNPGILIHLTTRQLPSSFSIESFDAAVFHDTHNWPGTIAHHLMDAEMVAVCSPKLNAKRAIKTLADIANFPLLHQNALPGRWAELIAATGAMLNGPLPGHTYQNFAMLAQAAVAGLGIALLPRYLVEEELMDKRLEIVARQLIDVKISYYLIVPETRASSSAIQIFANWLIAEARSWNSSNGHVATAAKAARRPNGRNLARYSETS
jgi:LysR family transcriptional regulator, glycine cleavage system transcriptional activator